MASKSGNKSGAKSDKEKKGIGRGIANFFFKASVIKANAKPKSKKGKAEVEEEPTPKRNELPGLGVFAIVLISLIALLSDFAYGGQGNILGKYFGTWWANALYNALGKLPLLFYLTAFAIFGVQIFLGPRLWRQIGIITAMGFLIALWLGAHYLGGAPLPSDYPGAGGWLGNFLVQSVLSPVFGSNGTAGSRIIIGILFFFLVVWGFKLSVAALLSRTANVAGSMGRSIADGWRSSQDEEDEGDETDEEPESTVAPVLVAGAALSKKSIPGKSRKREEPTEQILPVEGDSPEEEKRKLEALLESGNLEGLDPLTIRKIRDLALERKRVTELNEWETKNRSPEIGGLLVKGKPEDEQKPVDISQSKPKKTPKVKPVEVPKEEPALFDEVEDEEELEIPVAGFDDEPEAPDEFDSEDDFVPPPKKKSSNKPEPVSLALQTSPDSGEETCVPATAPTVKYDPYRLPNLDDIFPDPPVQALEFTEEELHEQSKLLEDQLNNFKVRGKVNGIHPGPVITRYEVELAPGEKVNRISNLADDLALALRAKSIRILAPIPGKSLVGVEVPNRKAQIVYIKEILAAPEFKVEEDTLKIAVGKTIGGDPYIADLTRAPHVLIAGQTGSGKSVCINSIMASLLISKTPDELRMILIDPKVVELKPYDAIPHLLRPVITQPDVAVQALKWATVKMDERYDVLSQCGVRNIKGYNQKVREGRLPEELEYNQYVEFESGTTRPGMPKQTIMPYILIVIDELADLMMVAGKEVETNIARIAQKARAVGIHLILATQRPSTNVITGTIKANLPTRIAFQVASQIDARTILDRQGAEKLLGRGDMLYRPIEFPEPVRLHGCFIDDEQCEKIAGACSGQFVNFPQVKTFNLEEDTDSGKDVDEERDAKFREAAELVVQLKQASVSLLQRRLGLGYARSGRLVDQLERAGIVGRERGSKPREVTMNEEELHSFLSSHDATESA